jgi:hypothetical protein
MNKKVDLLEEEIQIFANKFANIENQLENINSFIQKDSEIIENELNQTMIQYLKQQFQGHAIKRYDDIFKTIKNPRNNEKLTEFDGLYFFTNLKFKSRIIVILEAKRYTTIQKINHKLEQYKTINEIIALAVRTTDKFKKKPIVTEAFKKSIPALKLNEVDAVYLYIGGPYWENGAIEYIKEIQCNNKMIGYIVTSGTRYEIFDEIGLKYGAGVDDDELPKKNERSL